MILLFSSLICLKSDDLLESPLGVAMYRAIDLRLDRTEYNVWLRST
jgi:hypothetical protein